MDNLLVRSLNLKLDSDGVYNITHTHNTEIHNHLEVIADAETVRLCIQK